MLDSLKPRKIINRLPDMDMWMVCDDLHLEQAKEELVKLLIKNGISTTDVNPILSIEKVHQISEMLRDGKLPEIYLPIDVHIIEYSALKQLIENVPNELNNSKEKNIKPYLPIQPISYRKQWQYDDEAYNFIYDFLSAFTPFNFDESLQKTLNKSIKEIVSEHTSTELFDYLLKSATNANFRRFQTPELENIFLKKVKRWKDFNRDEEIR